MEEQTSCDKLKETTVTTEDGIGSFIKTSTDS